MAHRTLVRPWGSDQLDAVSEADVAEVKRRALEPLPDALRARTLGVIYPNIDERGHCWFDETHRVAVVNPRWDGFLVASFIALQDIVQLRIVPDEALTSSITVHTLNAPLRRGQIRPVDLELHPGTLPRRGVTGYIEAFDGLTRVASVPLRVTLFPSRSVTCSVAGVLEGPLPMHKLERAVARIRGGWYPAARLSSQIERAERKADRTSTTGGEPWWHLREDDG
ncbi:MAG: hypothetical protein H7123_02260 [Thermoleophilia bacterium]|nr:hypothetical protein [Thermoleophilia bacterium]